MSKVMFTPEQQAEVDRIVGERLARDREVQTRRLTPGDYRGSGIMTGPAETRVMAEPRKYSLHSPYSWYADVTARAEGGNHAQAAAGRLADYERELGWHMSQGTREGRRAERILRVADRSPNPVEHERRYAERLKELRGFGTDGGLEATAPGEAAAFVSPAFLMDQWAPFRGAARSFTDQCLKVPLPSFGMKIYVPRFSTTDEVAEQSEGSEVTEADPETALEASPTVATITGKISYSQQLRDRGGSGGGAMDVLIGRQLQQQLDEAIDKYVLARVIEQATAVTGSTTPWTVTVPGEGQTWEGLERFYKDISTAREKIVDTAGTKLRPTHLFSTSDFYAFVSRIFDKSARPVFMPSAQTGYPVYADADDHDEDNQIPEWSRFTGTVMPGGLVWVTDDNIPVVGTTVHTQILVSSPGDAIVVMEDPPILTPFVETKANTLRVVLNLRSYVACITRHSPGTSVVSGAAYLTSQK